MWERENSHDDRSVERGRGSSRPGYMDQRTRSAERIDAPDRDLGVRVFHALGLVAFGRVKRTP